MKQATARYYQGVMKRLSASQLYILLVCIWAIPITVLLILIRPFDLMSLLTAEKSWHEIEVMQLTTSNIFKGLPVAGYFVYSAVFTASYFLFRVCKFDILKLSAWRAYVYMPTIALLCGAIPQLIGIIGYIMIAPIPIYVGNFLAVKFIRYHYTKKH